jgi:hypothetical protein
MNKKIQDQWADILNHKELNDLVASLLEAAGPLNLVLAQLVYIGQPVLSTFIPAQRTSKLARILEDPAETELFIEALRSER